VEKRLQVAVTLASPCCTSLHGKTISPVVVRRSTSMHLLQSGVDLAVIALYLKLDSVVTTHHYLQADLKRKMRAMAALRPPEKSAPLPVLNLSWGDHQTARRTPRRSARPLTASGTTFALKADE